MPGAQNACFDPKATMDNGEMPAEHYDPLKYPFLHIDFFETEGEVIHSTVPAYEHVDAAPEECDPCREKKERIAELEKEIEDLKKS